MLQTAARMDTPAGLLQREKEHARALLAEGYAQDWIDQAELDRRMEAVERAGAIAQVQALTTDLRPVGAGALVPVDHEPQQLRVLFGAVRRGGAWTVAARTRVRVTFGSATLDLRQAALPPGALEIEAQVVCGSLELIVPPGWRIDNQCGAILAAVEHEDEDEARAVDGRVLRLRGRVLLGSLEIQERLPGESAGAAKKRRKRERKAQRKALEGKGRKALPKGRRRDDDDDDD